MRFSVSAWAPRDGAAWRAAVERFDELGFDTVCVADHIGMLDPFTAIGAAGQVSARLTFATYVINLGFWNPLVLARAAASAGALTSGRFTLGIGAGHAEVEFAAAGLRYPPAGERVTELAATLPALRRVLDGETVDDEVLGLQAAATGIGCERIPLLVGGNGDRVLALAGTHADVAGIVGFTSGTGQVHTALSHWTWAGMRDRIERVRTAASAAGRDAAAVSFDVLVQQVAVTDDREAVAQVFADGSDQPVEAHLDSPFVLAGTEAEIGAQLDRLEAEGVGGITVFEPSADALAAVLASRR